MRYRIKNYQGLSLGVGESTLVRNGREGPSGATQPNRSHTSKLFLRKSIIVCKLSRPTYSQQFPPTQEKSIPKIRTESFSGKKRKKGSGKRGGGIGKHGVKETGEKEKGGPLPCKQRGKRTALIWMKAANRMWAEKKKKRKVGRWLERTGHRT